MPSAGGLRAETPHRCCGGELLLRLIALEYLADLEQRDLREAPVSIALGRHHKSWNEAWSHV
jgi:hypothetical protein